MLFWSDFKHDSVFWVLAVKEHPVTQNNFRIELAVTLCEIGLKESPNRGISSSSQETNQLSKRMKASAVVRPP